MELAILGLGRMGGNMVRRLLRDGHHVVAYNRSPGPTHEAEQGGAVGAFSVAEVIEKLAPPRVVWMMIPAGDPVDAMIQSLLPLMSPGDILIDGGNSNWKDSVRRAADVTSHQINYLDVGVSGGIWGLQIGYCLMIGGDEAAYRTVEPAFKTLAPPNGYAYLGGPGAGHFSKMVHNGIEYGMLQAYAEGFEILNASRYDYDLAALSKLWNQGSVVRSWLLELAERAFEQDPGLESIRGYVEDSGEGRWTVQAAIDEDVPAPVLTLSLMMRFRSRQEDSFGAKVVAALRHQFGGHAVQEELGVQGGTSTGEG
ncbi:MAG TPA: decarboxylating 6-phosphogluconate dehydrogenase [Thermomicrobiaceae bacterium]|nr:decarboxylating 6-phosphogluconate dehydrogenase [Thermomicrobiaceae bacterium]